MQKSFLSKCLPYIFISPFFILFIGFGVYPLGYAFYLSLTNWHGFGQPKLIGFDNYWFLFKNEYFWKSLGNTAYLWLAIVPLQLVFSIIIASLLSHRFTKIKGFFRTVFLIPYLVPVVALAQVWLVMFNKNFGAVNQILGVFQIPPVGWLTTSTWAKPTLALLSLWKYSGFAILIMVSAIQQIPQDIYEAATLDGANAKKQFFRITLPLLKRATAFYSVYSTLRVIEMFTEPYVLTEGGPYGSTTTAGYGLMRYMKNLDFGTGSANSFLLMIIVIAVSGITMWILRIDGE